MFRGNWSSLLVSGAINFADSQQQQSKWKIEKVLFPIVILHSQVVPSVSVIDPMILHWYQMGCEVSK
jgi:hypothetical protein